MLLIDHHHNDGVFGDSVLPSNRQVLLYCCPACLTCHQSNARSELYDNGSHTCNVVALLCLTSSIAHAANSTGVEVWVTCKAQASCTSSFKLCKASGLKLCCCMPHKLSCSARRAAAAGHKNGQHILNATVVGLLPAGTPAYLLPGTAG